MLRPEEVEMLVCGNPNLNLADLKRVTVYDGYSANDVTITVGIQLTWVWPGYYAEPVIDIVFQIMCIV